MENINKKSVGYTLFLYRQEVSRTKKNYKRLNQTKISLTDDLTSKGVKNLKECSMEDLQAITRELKYKQKLKRNLHHIRKMEKNGVKNANPDNKTKEQ